jgi:hypothetical protein
MRHDIRGSAHVSLAYEAFTRDLRDGVTMCLNPERHPNCCAVPILRTTARALVAMHGGAE